MKRARYFLLAGILAAGLWYGWTHKDLFLNIRKISPGHIAALILLTFLSEIQTGYKFKLLMAMFRIDLDFQTWYGLSLWNTMFNYYLPARGGLVARACYLKQRYQFDYCRYTSLLAGSCVISFPISGLVGLAATVLSAGSGDRLHWTFVVVFGFLLLLTTLGSLVMLLLLAIGKGSVQGRFGQWLRSVEDGLHLFLANRRILFWHSVVHTASILTWAARLLVALTAVGVDAHFSDAAILSCLAMFAVLLPLTPANLGVNEGIIAGSAHVLGISADSALLAALLDRAVAVIMVSSLGIFFSQLLLSRLSSGEPGLSARK